MMSDGQDCVRSIVSFKLGCSTRKKMDNVWFFSTSQAQFLKQLQNGSGDDQHVKFVQNFAKLIESL